MSVHKGEQSHYVIHITMATGKFLPKNRLKSRVYHFPLLFLARSKLEMYHENISTRLNNVVISIKGNVFLRFEQAESSERITGTFLEINFLISDVPLARNFMKF